MAVIGHGAFPRIALILTFGFGGYGFGCIWLALALYSADAWSLHRRRSRWTAGLNPMRRDLNP